MRISEIFYSIQGEGRLIGIPSVFVRTSGCNLRCAWCDTPYTSWQPEGQSYTVAKILRELEKYPARHVVITGGEPLLAREIEELTAELNAAAAHHHRNCRDRFKTVDRRLDIDESETGEFHAVEKGRRQIRRHTRRAA